MKKLNSSVAAFLYVAVSSVASVPPVSGFEIGHNFPYFWAQISPLFLFCLSLYTPVFFSSFSHYTPFVCFMLYATFTLHFSPFRCLVKIGRSFAKVVDCPVKNRMGEF